MSRSKCQDLKKGKLTAGGGSDSLRQSKHETVKKETNPPKNKHFTSEENQQTVCDVSFQRVHHPNKVTSSQLDVELQDQVWSQIREMSVITNPAQSQKAVSSLIA